MSRDHYAILGLHRTASQQAVKQAYRDLVKRLHPDRDPSPKAAAQFLRVQQAYETLRDPLLRIAYDAQFDITRQRPLRDRPNPPKQRERQTVPEEPDIKTRSWAFVGLHLTGLVFGIVVVLGILTGIAFRDWPWGVIFFTLPGLLVIPDAWEGLRMAFSKARRGSSMK